MKPLTLIVTGAWLATATLLFQSYAHGGSAVELDRHRLLTAAGGGCAGLCDTLACHNSACGGGTSKTVGSGDYYVCNDTEDKNIRCILGEPEDCYTSYWNCTAGSNCTEGCTFTVFRKPRSCSDD